MVMEQDGGLLGSRMKMLGAHVGASTQANTGTGTGAGMGVDKPYMEILVQPQPKFRFRYKSEMTGKHGSLLGIHPSPFQPTKILPTEKNNIALNYIQSNLNLKTDLNTMSTTTINTATTTTAAPKVTSAPRSQAGEHNNLNVPQMMPTSNQTQQKYSISNQLLSSTPKSISETISGASTTTQSASSATIASRTLMMKDGQSGAFPMRCSGAGTSSAFASVVGPKSFVDPLCFSSGTTSISSTSTSTSSANPSYTAEHNNGFKIYPTVKLHNFPEDAIIRCSLVNEVSPHYPHPHVLEMGQLVGTGSMESYEDSTFFSENHYIEIPVSSNSNHVAVFQGLNIIYIGKKGMRRQLISKLGQLEDGDVRKMDVDQIETWSLNANLNVVCLYFEAFLSVPVPDDVLPHGVTRKRRKLVPICSPIVSLPIQHNKSTQTGDLRIVRIDKHTSYCTGDEEVFMLVEKVDKNNIQVKFFEESDKGLEIWKAYGKFSKLDVHHQYAIVFKTPPYRSCDIDFEVYVWLQLERPSDGATSLPIRFKYKPLERLRKMPKRQIPRSGHDYDSSGSGPSSGSGRPPGSDHDKYNSSGTRKSPQGENNQGNGNETSSCSQFVRQGSAQKFPCDLSNLSKFNAGNMGRAENTNVAFNVALSVGEGLHSWAETSDFNYLLHKLRHLLCLVDENGDNSLHAAISNKQREPFMRILNIMTSSPDIASALNEQNITNQTPVSLAVTMDCPDFARELVDQNVDLSIPNLEGDNPIHLAVKNNNTSCLGALLSSKKVSSVINRFNYSSMTPLHLAVANGHLEALDMICRTGASLNVQEGTFGRTPLHLAVEKGSITATMLLLQAAGETGMAEIGNVQNYRGDTPLHVAASSGLVAICAILLYYEADPTIENYIIKETNESEMDEIRIGQTAIDVSANQEVLKTMDGTMESWEKIVKACSQLLDSQFEKDQKFSLDSLHIDSGIDIKDQPVYSKYEYVCNDSREGRVATKNTKVVIRLIIKYDETILFECLNWQ